MSTSEWIQLASIPVFTGVIGWLINWSGADHAVQPGPLPRVRVPGLAELSTLLPRKLQEIPGIMQGGIGWQGIVPARAAKMGSIAADKAISKLGTPAEFYQQLEPDQIAEHIVTMFEPEMPGDRRRGHAAASTRACGTNLPPRVKRGRLRPRPASSCPRSSRQITDEIGDHIDQLLDPKIMVIDHFEQNPDAGRPDLPRHRQEGAAT